MRLNIDRQMRLLLPKSEEFWIELLNDYLINVNILYSIDQSVPFLGFYLKKIYLM